MKAKPATWKFVVGAVTLAGIVAVMILLSAKNGPHDVARVAHADPELQAASKEAQKGLAGFIKELLSPKPDEGFAIKAPLRPRRVPSTYGFDRQIIKTASLLAPSTSSQLP